jgi:DNA-binding beta-propeller fold protein YncE
LVIAVIVAAGWWLLTRPAAVAIEVTPADATITFLGEEYVGAASVEELDPGEYDVELVRTGFETLTVTIELSRGRTTETSYELSPLPQPFSLASNPTGADYRIETADGRVLEGVTPFLGDVPAGDVSVTLTLDGHNDYRRDLFIEEATDLALWMDPAGQLVHCLGVFDCGPAPKGAVFSPDGSQVWTTLLSGPPSVESYDPVTGELLAEFTLGEHGAVEVVFSQDGAHAYVSQMETARVYDIVVASGEVTRTLDTESAWSKVVELSPDGKTLFVANWSGNDVSEFDLETGELSRRLPTVRTPRGLYVTSDGDHLYVAGFDRGDIDKIDLEDGSRTTVFTGGGAIRHLAADEERGLLYASDMAEDVVWVLDLTTDEVTEFCDTDEKPNTIDISPDGKVLFVSCRGANNATSYYLPGPEWGSVLLFDTGTGELLDAIVGGNQPTALDVSDDGTRLVFSDFLDDRLRVYEIPPYEELAAGGGGRAASYRADLAK